MQLGSLVGHPNETTATTLPMTLAVGISCFPGNRLQSLVRSSHRFAIRGPERLSVTREELHSLVWSVPMQRLKTSFRMSDVALAKHCAQADVPVPSRGWWAKKAAGKEVAITPLPPLPIGEVDRPINLEMPREYAGAGTSASTKPDGPPEFPNIALFKAEVERVVTEVKTPARLANPHPIVAKLLQQDEERRGKIKSGDYSYAWSGPRFDDEIQRRRLRILSGLLFAFEQHGCRLRGSKHSGEDFELRVRDTSFRLVLGVEAPAKGVFERNIRWRKPDGAKSRIRFQVGDHSLTDDRRPGKPKLEWSDGDTPLDRQLTEVVRKIVVLAEEERRRCEVARYHREIAHRKWQEAERLKAAAQAEEERVAREKAAEAARRRALLDEAEAVGQAERIRRYVDEVRRRVANDPTLATTDELEAFASRALGEADRIDPVVSGRFLVGIRRPPT